MIFSYGSWFKISYCIGAIIATFFMKDVLVCVILVTAVLLTLRRDK